MPSGRGRVVDVLGGSALASSAIRRSCARTMLFSGSQDPTIFSIGCSARLARIMLANSMPEWTLWSMISQAPIATISTCITMRTALIMSAYMLEASAAVAPRSMVTRRCRAQAAPSVGSMPMARTTSPLRSAASVKL